MLPMPADLPTKDSPLAQNPCPVCATPIPADAPNGMCPRCLLAEGTAESSSGASPGSLAETLAGTAPPANQSSQAASLPAHLRYVGDYELIEEIARGGMGVVYRAKQASLSRVVAVKMILAGNLADESAVRRFRQEAAAAAALDHPHIVPIYEVGEQEGRHYFSMGYVPGSSLAERLKDGPLPANEAAQLVLTIAEAVQYAHDQGVIHRDLKPANILLDEQGRPRVTDFGLAKISSQDQSLTRTGQAVGTPGYMPPEQVQNGEIGPTADVYALGAILYALLTGRPPFQAATPLDTMLQVIAAEPASPRMLNPAVPRDLETIALKCLEKRTEWRYQTARDLANELQRFLEGEPISARPPGIVERGLRWLGKQRRGVALVVIASAASVFAIVAGTWTYSLYQQSLAGKLRLSSSTNERLAATVLDLQGKEVIPVQSLPTRQPESLPAGEYVVRASDRGLLGDDFLVQVASGEEHRFDLNLKAARLRPELTIDGSWHVVHTRGTTGGAHLLLLSKGHLELKNLEYFEENLETLLDDKPSLQQLKNFRAWPWGNTVYAPSGVGNRDYRPQVVAHPPNLDAGGLGDVIIAYRHQPVIVAVSADTAKLWWTYAPEGFSANQPSDLLQPRNEPMYGAVIGAPLVVPDLDQDGIADLVAAFVHIEPLPANSPRPPWDEQPRRTIEAISAKTGKRLWRHDLPDKAFLPVDGEEFPSSCLWFPGPPGDSGGGISSTEHFGNWFRFYPQNSPRGRDQIVVPWPPQLVTAGGVQRIVCVAGTTLVQLNVQTGEPVQPAHSLGALAVCEPKFANVVGQDEPELILIEQLPPVIPNLPFSGKVQLHVRQLATGEPVFAPQVHEAEFKRPSANFQPSSQWPLVEDLNGDGRAEIITASGTSIQLGRTVEINDRAWAGLVAIDGTTGESFWKRPLDTVDQQLDQLLVGPDINGDGWRDIFVATIFLRRHNGAQLYVDALSGKDGQSLWTNCVPLPLVGQNLSQEVIGKLQWWNAGSDGWPQLMVPVLDCDSNQPLGLTCFSAGTGTVTRTSDGLSEPFIDDLNGDGTKDLVVFEPTERRILDQGGRLSTFVGASPQPWRAIGRMLQSADDFDGDGRDDLLPARDHSGPRAAISGQTGRLLWERRDNEDSKMYQPLHADFNGDGVADFVGIDGPRANSGPTSPLRLYSGKTGQLLWNAGFGTRTFQHWAHLSACDLEHDGKPELAFLGQMDFEPDAAGRKHRSDCQSWLVVLNAQGQIRLQQQISGWLSETELEDRARITPVIVDLNRDGCDDVVVPVLEPGDQRCLVALDGRSVNKELWKVELPLGATPPKTQRVQGLPLIGSGDLNGDGVLDLLFHLPLIQSSSEYTLQIHALDGSTGNPLPGWPLERTPADSKLSFDAVREYSANEHFEPTRPRPEVVQLGAERLVVTWQQGASYGIPARLLLLSSTGQPLWELTVKTESVFRPWLRDVNGDGQTDCVIITDVGVEAYNLSTHTRIWRFELPVFGVAEIVGSENRGSNEPAVLLVANDRSLFGLSIRDASVVWRSVALPHNLSVSERNWQLLRHTNPDQPPYIVSGRKDLDVICRRFETVDDPRTDLARSGANTGMRLQRDPRYSRPLPWTIADSKRPLQLEAPTYLVSGLLFSLLLFVLPAWLGWRFVTRWQFNLGQLLLVPPIIGLLVVGLQLPVPQAPYVGVYVSPRVDIAFQLSAVWITAGLIVVCLARGRWKLAGAAIACSLLTTAAVTAVYWQLDELAAQEYYVSDGWWQVLILGAYLAAWLIVGISLLATLIQKAIWWRKDRK
jgi:serine/threonine protein kinase/outer membrane protein assembly factor BamB